MDSDPCAEGFMYATPEEYLRRTELAARGFFLGISDFVEPLKRAPAPVFVCDYEDDEKCEELFEQWLEISEPVFNEHREALKEYLEAVPSNAMYCASALQLASLAIQSYCSPAPVPLVFSDAIKPAQKPARFCRGRLVCGLPIGLIIYAGRNQAAHIDDQNPHEITRRVFHFLSVRLEDGREHGAVYPALDLSNPQVVNFAHNVTALLAGATIRVTKRICATSWASKPKA
jgi:hypothetical protein